MGTEGALTGLAARRAVLQVPAAGACGARLPGRGRRAGLGRAGRARRGRRLGCVPALRPAGLRGRRPGRLCEVPSSTRCRAAWGSECEAKPEVHGCAVL